MNTKLGLKVVSQLWCFVRVLLLCIALCGCDFYQKDKTVINLSFTPWVGYFPFYFAIEKNIPDKYGADLRIQETLTVQDFRRTNIKAHVDAFACSLMELTRTNSLLKENLELVSYLDYSNGADVIIAHKDIHNMSELEGHIVGFDWRSLGHFFFLQALKFEGLEDTGFIHRQVGQVAAMEYFDEGTLEGYVTYPPISTELLKNDNLHVIFDSSSIPYQLMDVLVIKEGHPDKRDILRYIWRDVMIHIKDNPSEFAEFVARLTDTTRQAVSDELRFVEFISAKQQTSVQTEDVVKLLKSSCEILSEERHSCLADLRKLFWQGEPLMSF